MIFVCRWKYQIVNAKQKSEVDVEGYISAHLDDKLGHISITFLPSAYVFCDIRANQGLNRPNMAKYGRAW